MPYPSDFGSAGQGIPFVAGEIRGIRSWDVNKKGQLLPVSSGSTPWEPGVNHARHTGDALGSLHRVATINCVCGFYAYHYEPHTRASVVGVIRGYGRVTQGTLGFRAEKAEILALCKPRPSWFKRLCLWTYHNDTFGAIVFIIAMISIAGTVIGGLSWIIFDDPAYALVFFYALAVFGVVVIILAMAMYGESLPYNRANMSPKVWKLVQQNYPDVRIFSSQEQMKREYDLQHHLDR